MRIATFSSVWGSSTGGIDVFNMDLVRSLASTKSIQICACLQIKTLALEEDSKKYGFQYVTSNSEFASPDTVGEIGAWTSEKAAAAWGRMKLHERFQPDYVILHDIFCKAILEDISDWAPEARIATFFHSAYGRSEKRKGKTDTELERKIQYQREMIEESDISIAVGSFSEGYLRSIVHSEFHPRISSISPGLPSMKSRARKADHFNAISFGRLDPVSDSLKQIRVSASAWREAFRSKQISTLQTNDIKFFAVGAKGSDSVLASEKSQIRDTWRAQILELPFEDVASFDGSSLQARMDSCAFALLNSWYENFGLTYLEACTFGLPTIVSESSGFYHELIKVIGRDDAERLVNLVRVEDTTEDQLISDIKLMLISRSQAFNETFEKAQELRELIINKWPSWKMVAKSLVDLLGSVAVKADRSDDEEKEYGHYLVSPHTPEPQDLRWNEKLADLRNWCWEKNLSYYHNMTSVYDYAKSSDFPLTALQKSFWDSRHNLIDHPFRDLILSGGTSSGKTTLAECLFGMARTHEFPRARILYVAPTKALAQERAEEWKLKFPSINQRDAEFQPVIISTGDDNASDGALTRGDFNIAATVYEKANIILTAGQDLLSKLNLVIIDEFHMLDDLHRGGVVECLLAKIRIEKLRRIDSVNKDNPLRVVIITTEAPGDSIRRFLSFDDDGTGDVVAPLMLEDSGRAREIVHSVVVPGRLDTTQPAVLDLRKFGRDEQLLISEGDVQNLTKRFATFQSGVSQIGDGYGFDAKRQRFQYQKEFCLSWLNNNPEGRRLLIFMSSKFDILEFARMLKNEVRKKPIFQLGNDPKELTVNRYGAHVLTDALDDVESTDFVQDIERCAEGGIFIHNADVPRKVRAAFEEYLGRELPRGARSEFVIATETLSYGVNLQINDVALLSVMFPENERVPTGKPESILLSRCDFVNMSGRAGRLNQRYSPRPAQVFWYLDPQQERSFEGVVRAFYGSSGDVRSSLLHQSDARSLARLQEQRKQALLLEEEVGLLPPGPLQTAFSGAYDSDPATTQTRLMRFSAVERLSYPFTRSVLDCVRFLGGTGSTVGSLRKPGCTVNEAISEFFFETLYNKQLSETVDGAAKGQKDPPELSPDTSSSDRGIRRQRVLVQAVKQVMESASQPQYQLLKLLSSGSFQITPLGSASIDTGTEIRTVVNIRHAVLALNTAWKSYFDKELPFELAVLPAFFQPEVYRQYIARLPEFRLAMEWDPAANRDDLIARVSQRFEKDCIIAAGDEFKLRAVISDFVDWTLSNQPIVSDPGRYEEAPYDACLRLFVGFLAWIHGLSLRNIIGEIQSIYPSSGQKTESSVFNFEAFAENLTWKITFLVSLLRASDEQILPATSTFDAVRFVHRARFGCVERAIPLLFRNKATVPPLNRVQAHAVIAEGYTSATIALGELDGKTTFGAKKERQARHHVRKFISESFHELSRQFSYLASGSGLGKINEEVSKRYWAFSTKQIISLLESGNPVDAIWELTGDAIKREREELLRQEYETSQFVIESFLFGVSLQTYQPSFESEESDQIRLRKSKDIGVRFSFGKDVGPVSSAIEMDGRGIIVDFPWAMGIDEVTFDDIRMSPAAFGILLSLCSREFLADTDRYLDAIIRYSGDGCIGTRELYSISQPHLKKGGFPEGLFDAWAKYIEVGEV